MMKVIRPANALKAVQTATMLEHQVRRGHISKTEFNKRWQAMLGEQEYTFQGYLSADGKIVDRWGAVQGKVQPGDSFVG